MTRRAPITVCALATLALGTGHSTAHAAFRWKNLLPGRSSQQQPGQSRRPTLPETRPGSRGRSADPGSLRPRARLGTLRPAGHAAVQSLLLGPDAPPRAVLVLAHGGGGSMTSDFMNAVAFGLAGRGVATLRFNFGYMQRLVDGQDAEPDVDEDFAILRAAVAEARRQFPDVPILVGGKSRGGVLTSHLAADGGLGAVDGVVMLGLPLHGDDPRKASTARHLDDITAPKLIVQGSADPLGRLDLVEAVARRSRATLHTVQGGDHSFRRITAGDADNRFDPDLVRDASHAVGDWIDALR